MSEIPLSNLKAPELPANSRYASVEISTETLADGRRVQVMGRRFLPPPSSVARAALARVEVGERADRIAGQHLGDPLLDWRLWDANGVSHPDELEDGRTRVRVPVPGAFPGDR